MLGRSSRWLVVAALAGCGGYGGDSVAEGGGGAGGGVGGAEGEMVAATSTGASTPTPTSTTTSTTVDAERYEAAPEGQMVEAAQDARVTFSLDVDTASYTLMRRDLRQRRLPAQDGVRVEEYLNF